MQKQSESVCDLKNFFQLSKNKCVNFYILTSEEVLHALTVGHLEQTTARICSQGGIDPSRRMTAPRRTNRTERGP